MPSIICAGVADKADDHRGVDYVLQLLFAQHIGQEAGEKGARAQGDNRQVHHDPHAKGEVVVHVGLVKALIKDQEGRQQAQAPRAGGCIHSRNTVPHRVATFGQNLESSMGDLAI
jgi:hypothetical protein